MNLQNIELFFKPSQEVTVQVLASSNVTLTFSNLEKTAKVYTSETVLIVRIDQKNYQLNQTCKMQPLFVQIHSEVQVKEIIIYEPKDNHLSIKCNTVQQLKPIYLALCRVISHKGFNQFYKPLKRLGRGTFATVYLIEHKFTKKQKAAKVFSREGQKIQFKGKEALQNEIKTLREINHHNIIRYDGIYETENLIYLVTEYISGGTLQDTLKCKSMHTGEFVSKILKDILQGLKYLSSKNIMHRDIKPENIIYRKEQDMWVLGDFGLAAISTENYLYDKCGTMGYIAPQIMAINQQNPKKYSQQCDIYSLGIIAYTLIIGSLPFHVQSESLFDKRIVWDLFDKPECKQVNKEVLKFLGKLLQSDPTKRFTAKQALQSSFFTDSQVRKGMYEYHERRRQERYDKILQIANIN